MPKFTVRTKRIIILGVILLASVSAYCGQYEYVGVAIGGMLGLLKDDTDIGD
jgi:hypothetical protein